jgi:hypothetical protein
MSRKILNGWKEVSNYIERGVRTAQRWEALLGMPVHRPALKDRSAVVAFSDELDRWLARTAPDSQDEVLARGVVLSRIQESLRALNEQAAEVASQSRMLREQLGHSRENRRKMADARDAKAAGAAPSLAKPVVAFKRERALGRTLTLP